MNNFKVGDKVVDVLIDAEGIVTFINHLTLYVNFTKDAKPYIVLEYFLDGRLLSCDAIPRLYLASEYKGIYGAESIDDIELTNPVTSLLSGYGYVNNIIPKEANKIFPIKVNFIGSSCSNIYTRNGCNDTTDVRPSLVKGHVNFIIIAIPLTK